MIEFTSGPKLAVPILQIESARLHSLFIKDDKDQINITNSILIQTDRTFKQYTYVNRKRQRNEETK